MNSVSKRAVLRRLQIRLSADMARRRIQLHLNCKEAASGQLATMSTCSCCWTT